jgi:hypothetical protein
LAGGNRLEHIEVRRNDEVYLDALGAQRIPEGLIPKRGAKEIVIG